MRLLSITRAAPVIAFLVVCASITFIAGWIIPYAEVLWDEGVFLLWNWRMYEAIASGNISGISAATYWQFEYPPLQSYVVSLLLQPFSFTVTSARLVHLIFFAGSCVLVYLVAVKIARSVLHTKQLARVAASLAVIFFALSPLVLYLSSVLLKELPATCMALLTVYFYIIAREKKYLPWYILPALALAGLFFTKYQYAIFYTLAFGLETGFAFVTSKNKLHVLLSHVLLIVPLLISFTGWVIFTNRFSHFLSRIFNAGFNYTGGLTDQLTYLLFYPRGILYSYSFSPVWGLCIVATAAVSIIFWKYSALRIGMIAFLINLFFLMRHTLNVQERYLVTTIPFLFIASSIVTIFLIYKFKNTNTPARVMIYSFLCIVGIAGIPDLFRVPQRIYAIGSMAMKGMAFAQTDYNDTWFNYDRNTWSSIPPWQSTEKPSNIAEFIADTVDPTKTFTFYGSMNEIPPDYITLLLEQKNNTENTNDDFLWYVATVELSPTSLLRTKDYQKVNAWKEFEIISIKENTSLETLARKEYPTLGATVTLYGGK